MVGDRKEPVDDLQEAGAVQRFAQVLEGARGQQPLPLPGGDVGADHHHRHRGGLRVGLEAPQHLLAVDAGKVQVQQDQVGSMPEDQVLDALAPRRGQQPHGVRALAQDAFDQPQVGGGCGLFGGLSLTIIEHMF